MFVAANINSNFKDYIMRQILILLSFLLLISCGNSKKPSVETVEFKKYSSVLEALKAANDFSVENGTLKVLSKEGEPIHIQVSKPIFEGDLEDVIIQQTKRDVVYVAFQAFAETDINELTVTSIPVKDKSNYVDKYKMTVTVNRVTAKNILKKYLATESFQDLYKLEGTLYLPSARFDKLKFADLDKVFSDLSNR